MSLSSFFSLPLVAVNVNFKPTLAISDPPRCRSPRPSHGPNSPPAASRAQCPDFLILQGLASPKRSSVILSRSFSPAEIGDDFSCRTAAIEGVHARISENEHYLADGRRDRACGRFAAGASNAERRIVSADGENKRCRFPRRPLDRRRPWRLRRRNHGAARGRPDHGHVPPDETRWRPDVL